MFKAAPGKSFSSYAPYNSDMTMNGQKFGKQMSATLPMTAQARPKAGGSYAAYAAQPAQPQASVAPPAPGMPRNYQIGSDGGRWLSGGTSARNVMTKQPTSFDRGWEPWLYHPSDRRYAPQPQEPANSAPVEKPSLTTPGSYNYVGSPVGPNGERWASQPPQRASVIRAYDPGMAQPVAPPSFGTPLGDDLSAVDRTQGMTPWGDVLPPPDASDHDAERRRRLTQGVTNYLPGKRGIDYRNSYGPRMSGESYDLLPGLEQEFPGVDEDTLIAIANRRVAKQREGAIDRARAELGQQPIYEDRTGLPQESWVDRRNREMVEEARRANQQSMANIPGQGRPAIGQSAGAPAFQASFGNPFGGPTQQPNFGQRDAFISNINNQLGQMQQQSWLQPGSIGAPQLDFQNLWGRAGDMVKQGWQNPLTGLLS